MLHTDIDKGEMRMSRKGNWKEPVEGQRRSDMEFQANRVCEEILAFFPQGSNFAHLLSKLVCELLNYPKEDVGSDFFVTRVRPAISRRQASYEQRVCLAAFVAGTLVELVKGNRLTEVIKQTEVRA